MGGYGRVVPVHRLPRLGIGGPLYPDRTTYHLATCAQDYRLCHALQRALDDDAPVPVKFPTVYAVRDGVFLGFLGTHPDRYQVVAGPLLIDPVLKNRIFVAIRLVEAYENVLHRAGVTQYVMGIDHTNPTWRAQLEKRGYTPYTEDAAGAWYIKKIA